MDHGQKGSPPVDYSLNSISWHLKVISDELKRLNYLLAKGSVSEILNDGRKAASNDPKLPF